MGNILYLDIRRGKNKIVPIVPKLPNIHKVPIEKIWLEIVYEKRARKVLLVLFFIGHRKSQK